jgi:ankyrin repeat protein
MKSLMGYLYRVQEVVGWLDLNGALHNAAAHGDADTVRALMAAGKEIYEDADAVLISAAGRGDIALAKILLAIGADINSRGGSPLHFAVFNGHLDMVKALLKTDGVNIHAQGDIALRSAFNNHAGAEFIDYTPIASALLEAGADPFAVPEVYRERASPPMRALLDQYRAGTAQRNGATAPTDGRKDGGRAARRSPGCDGGQMKRLPACAPGSA